MLTEGVASFDNMLGSDGLKPPAGKLGTWKKMMWMAVLRSVSSRSTSAKINKGEDVQYYCLYYFYLDLFDSKRQKHRTSCAIIESPVSTLVDSAYSY